MRERVGMVFQQFNLFPHMTALQNVMEGLLTVKEASRRLAVSPSTLYLLMRQGRLPFVRVGRYRRIEGRGAARLRRAAAGRAGGEI